MKTTIYSACLLLMGLAAASCEKEDFRYQDAFETSYRKWQDFKGSSGNSYRFTVTRGTWAGSSWKTTLTVEKGQVTRRDFQYTVFDDIVVPPGGWTVPRAQAILDSLNAKYPDRTIEATAQDLAQAVHWTEEGDELGSHENTPAAPLLTLDEVYDRARSQWLVKRDDVSTSFEADNNGLISSCGYVVNGCQDDCFVGISIASIEKLKNK